MLPDSSQIKKAAHTVLRQNYLCALVVSFVVMATTFFGWLTVSVTVGYIGEVLSYVVLALFTFLVGLPIVLGAVRYFSLLIEGISVKPVEMFYYFSSLKAYFRAIIFAGSIYLIIALSVVTFMLIPTVMLVFSEGSTYKALKISMPIWIPALKTAAIFLEVVAGVLVVVSNIKYYLAVYLFACNDKISPLSAISFSKRLSKRTKPEFWFLVFSLAGYILLSLPVLPLFFILPFFMLCYVIHSKCAAIQHNEIIDFAKQQYTVTAK